MVRTMRSVVMSLLLFFVCIAPATAVGPGKKLTWPGGGQGKVTFDGSDHSDENYICADCHPRLFVRKFGTAKMTMDAMNRGEFCGACHNGTRTFATDDPKRCEECHRKPRKHGKKPGND